ncbi:phosphate acetyltransferase [Mycoplasmopsis californica HAZ160_1]|uniref:Phosphate acetyltransferase n=1 Tax=Mycoplasmopsis californica HAZ160_1 TaxID=1397850 RepID=A0AAT9F878_9BACT|nr:phosphotransacetylase [Mycoplasmopsis californica]BAP01085.1 phosphate acetyltransferase [Mycoplasmopsis californica HAZ160_1]BBG40950.1 phosphate acetyltransferase [Mycoplasmopsis californica]BBG41544.1 phosphate acetyltransferase [Mycoplasmopsis californica]BBG42137.1 phosphate acetyltransferase [Mycoplasmopsis californica]BBG42720.1 phosphate acetyltransferase [Mycoplasmopsis californica]
MEFTSLIQKTVNNIGTKKRIVIVDGDDDRAIEASKILEQYQNCEVILLTEKDITINTKATVINIHADADKKAQLAQLMFEQREAAAQAKGKENKDTLEVCQKAIEQRPFYAMMLLQNGEVDGVVGGLIYSTADMLRAAFKVIGSAKGIKTISSVMIMHKGDDTIFFSDISVNPKPDQAGLTDIGINAARFVKGFNIDPKVAFLSFSTNFSAKTPETEMVHNATIDFNAKYEGTKAIGEVQLDAAIDLGVRKAKYPLDSFNEPANTLIFPNLEAGNIGYKLVQRLAGYGAIGPIIVGTNKPVNDLSRGAKVNDVVNTVLITMIQSEGVK